MIDHLANQEQLAEASHRSVREHGVRRPYHDRMTALLTAQMCKQYETDGFILERALSDEQLELLRGGAAYAIDKADAEMDAAGVDRLKLNARGKRYFSEMIYRDRPELRRFLFSDTMAEICRATLGEQAYLFWEQYVIKAADPVGSSFAWHQDSGYVHEEHAPYLTVWIALDDVTEDNGSVYLAQYSKEIIMTRDGSRPWGSFEQFLKDGNKVLDS